MLQLPREDILEPIDTPWRIDDPDIEAWTLSDNGTTINHHRKRPDIAIVDSELTQGVSSFTFKIRRSHNNKGHNIYIGVMDARASRSATPPGDGSRAEGQAGAAWLWHTYDGSVRHRSHFL